MDKGKQELDPSDLFIVHIDMKTNTITDVQSHYDGIIGQKSFRKYFKPNTYVFITNDVEQAIARGDFKHIDCSCMLFKSKN
jgi:hypothetical protein